MLQKPSLYILLVIIVVVGGWFLFSGDDRNVPEIEPEPIVEENNEESLPPLQTESSDSSEMASEPERESEEDDNAPEEVEALEETEPLTDEEMPLPETKTYVVTYTAAGFTPKTMIISAGDTVAFVNESNRGMWVASAVHPTHNVYPEESDSDCLGSTFDACTGTPSGGSWSFRFNETGAWDYHDHLSPSRTGTVEVE